jgi:indole-3-glycerol phosphate synthase
MQVPIIAEIVRTGWDGRPVRPEYGPGAGGGSNFDPVAIARQYAAGGAAAVSLVTEPGRGATVGDVGAVRDAVPLPLMRSDVVVDAWQLWESRAAGADAVRLIADALTEGQLVDLLILAQQLGLTTLLEVWSTEGLLRTRPYIGFPHRAYALLGINNRAVWEEMGGPGDGDVSATLRLLDLVDDPAIVVSEGCVRVRNDLERLAREGVRIALCGEELLSRDDPVAALRELNGLPVR